MIISQNGTVTLKGPVHNQEERNAIVAKAEEIAGSGKVTDNLSVKGDKGKSSKIFRRDGGKDGRKEYSSIRNISVRCAS
jgi:hypothetical protein